MGAIYGVVQGISEFLPISSSGHLALMPKLFNFEDPGVAFDLWLHVGTALAVIIYFNRDLTPLIKEIPHLLNREHSSAHRGRFINLAVATLVTLFFVIFLKDMAEGIGRSPKLISFNLVFFGVLMWAGDRFGHKNDEENFDKIQWGKSALIGLFQGMAVFPGVSRSGITLTVARFLGVTRQEAARFSFILSLPIIIGGAILKIPELRNSNFDISAMLVGLGGSFIVGIISIHFFLQVIKKLGLGIFCLYRVFFAGLVLYYLY